MNVRAITSYLEQHNVPYLHRPHPAAVSAQRLAQALHVSGNRVCKPVMVWVDGRPWMAVLPATHRLDPLRVSEALFAEDVSLMTERELRGFFPDVEVGAEPPLGRRYGIPVLLDSALAEQDTLVFRAGTHQDGVEVAVEDFLELEQPVIAPVGYRPERRIRVGEEAGLGYP